jgi:aminopeptidase N
MAALAAISLVACNQAPTSTDHSTADSVGREEPSGLTQIYAEFRATQVSNVRYGLTVELDPALPDFVGQNKIDFELTDTASDLTIDFSHGEIANISVNGTDIEIDYNDAFVTVPASELRAGENEVVVQFSHAWSDNGSGLYRYDDPDDGRTYLYTDFEPYDANLAFPLFDQPDIKGRFTMSITAPNDWQVVSTTRESSVTQANEHSQTWAFPESVPIPTYVMSLHAGPYAVWEDNDFRIPMRVFVRQSMAELVVPDLGKWFEYTRAGFDFFEEYYGVEYPYGKYDQLIVPDFNAVAMENAAAVTFTERSFIQRDGWSYNEKASMIRVILHEMAHQWFGNLVTMKWWNGLWLNETFAEFMGYHAAAAKLGIDDAWENFFLYRKYAAYWTDQRSTTHPVETPVPDTDSVGTNFDMISYAKGAAVLRQIEYRLGEDAFRQGINTYLERHAEGNARLEDFVGALAEASETDLDEWAEQWLYTAGANTIEAQFDCENGLVSSFALAQTAPLDYPILRTQKIQVGFFRDVDGAVITDNVFPVTYSGAVTNVAAAVGAICPNLVYPNHQDYGYLLVKLDPRTRGNLNTMIGNIEDSFQRVMFWQTLWDNVRFAQIPVTDYLDAVLASAATEDNLNNVDQIYFFVNSSITYLRNMQEQGADALEEYRDPVEAVTWANVERTRDDLQTMYLDRYLAFVSGNDGLERLVGILENEIAVPNREIDQDRRWIMLRVLSAEGHEKVDELLVIEKQRDPGDDGQRQALAVEAARPDIEVKRAIIADVLNIESENPYALQRISMSRMFPPGQEALHEMLADEILAQILENEKDPDPAFYLRARGFAAYLTPTSCTPASVARLESAVAAHESSRASIRRTIIESYENDSLCVQRAALLN